MPVLSRIDFLATEMNHDKLIKYTELRNIGFQHHLAKIVNYCDFRYPRQQNSADVNQLNVQYATFNNALKQMFGVNSQYPNSSFLLGNVLTDKPMVKEMFGVTFATPEIIFFKDPFTNCNALNTSPDPNMQLIINKIITPDTSRPAANQSHDIQGVNIQYEGIYPVGGAAVPTAHASAAAPAAPAFPWMRITNVPRVVDDIPNAAIPNNGAPIVRDAGFDITYGNCIFKSYIGPTSGVGGIPWHEVFSRVPVIDVAGGPRKQLFLVSDASPDILESITRYSHRIDPDYDTNVNIMFSVHTIGDSSSQIYQHSNTVNWVNTGHPSNHKRVYKYVEDITTNICDNVLMINAEVVSSFTGGSKENSLMVNQTWAYQGLGTPKMNGPYQNAHANNKKNIPFTGLSDFDKVYRSQIKRYGDHGQIWDCAHMFDIITNPATATTLRWDSTLVPGGRWPANTPGAAGIVDRLGVTDRNLIRRSTFYITGDWPAFCYAMYNKVNAIITFHNKCIVGYAE
jgi:hypothetical protein